MKKILLLFLLTLNFLTYCLKAQTSVPAGNVSGTWTQAGSPYTIQGDITIVDATTLTIQPGVTVSFQGTYKLAVLGRLLAIGTAVDTIVFTAANTTNGWKGIRFDNTSTTNDTSKIYYCKLLYGKVSGTYPNYNGGALYFDNFSKAIISNSRISNCSANNNGGAIFCTASAPQISNNTISFNSSLYKGGAIYCQYYNARIFNNTIFNNMTTDPNASGGGIYCDACNANISNNAISNNTTSYSSGFGSGGGGILISGGGPTISNNTITNNSVTGGGSGGGIFCSSGNPIFTNNTIANNTATNGGGICFRNSSSPSLNNCILWGNAANTSGAGVFLEDEASDPQFSYSDVQGGTAAFGLNGNTYTGNYSNNINTDPLFVSPSGGAGSGFNGTSANWTLQNTSPCINTGDPFGTYASTDKAGNARVTVCRIDMGAYEYQNGTPLSATITQGAQILCYGDSTATATVAAAGGSGVYSYVWNTAPFGNSATAIHLGAGTSSVTVTENGFGCSITKTVVIGQPAQLTFTATPSNEICNGANGGSIIVTATGGTGAYSYSKNGGSTYQSSAIFSGLGAGSYQVVVKDANNCVTPAQAVTITQPIAITFTTIQSNVLCYNGTSGSITVTASGGTGGLFYSKNGGSSYQSSNILSGLSVGTYQVIVSDAHNCVSTIQNVTITQPSAILFSTVDTNVTCHSSSNGSITIAASGGTGLLQYSKDNGTTFQTTSHFSNLPVAIYSIVVKDANNCLTAAYADTIIQSSAILLSPTHTNVLCHGQANGTAVANPTGGSGPVTYLWNSTPSQNTDTATNLAAGTYTITVNDSLNCPATATVVITQPAALSLAATKINASCTNNDGTISIVPSGGTAPYHYSWSNSSTNSSITGLSSGTYSLSVHDTNGCAAADTLVINNSTVPTAIQICMVTVDSASTKNVIAWEKPTNAPIDSFRIYREIASVYTHIGSVAYTALSEFNDNTNGINPNATFYKYKLSVVDTCGNESLLSTVHQTVHLQLGLAFPSGVNLSWSDYTGFTFSEYRILRDDLGNGIWHVLDSVGYGISTYTNHDALQNARYIVEAKRPTACVSTRSVTRTASKSNTALQTTGIDELTNEMNVLISPNPSNGKFVLLIENRQLKTDNLKISIYNLLGEQIYLSAITPLSKGKEAGWEVNLSSTTKGIYFVKISDGTKVYSRKIVVQ